MSGNQQVRNKKEGTVATGHGIATVKYVGQKIKRRRKCLIISEASALCRWQNT